MPHQYTVNDYGVETGYDWWSLHVTTGACEINNVNITNAFILDAESNSLIVSQRPEQVDYNITIDFDFVDASNCSIRCVSICPRGHNNYLYVFLVSSSRKRHVPQSCLSSTVSHRRMTQWRSTWAGMAPPGPSSISLIKSPRLLYHCSLTIANLKMWRFRMRHSDQEWSVKNSSL